MGASGPAGEDGLARVRLLPALDWIKPYSRETAIADLTAGTITAILLVPQAMAYAQLAGLPPEVGLYSSIVPILLYALFGTSRTLAVGPVAVAALMVSSALAPYAAPGSPEYLAGALFLAAASGAILVVMGLLRLGVIANLMSHPVMSGFTSAAAIVIAASQIKHLAGISMPSGLHLHEIVQHVATHLDQVQLLTLGIGLVAVVGLQLVRSRLAGFLKARGVSDTMAMVASRFGPLVIVIAAAVCSAAFDWGEAQGVRIVGSIPQGLPTPTVPGFEMARDLLPSALLIALVGFVESVAVAKALAAKRREKIDVNQDLIGLGLANLGAGFTAGAPVSGGFARSVVNFEAGARTQAAAIITALWITVTVLAFTSLFYHLPLAVLAAIIVVSVLTLVDFDTFKRAFAYDKADAAAWLLTFGLVIFVGIELGILIGVGASLALFLWRTARPHIAIVGRVRDTEHFRNINRHKVETAPHLIALRIDESLYFANAAQLEKFILDQVADQPEVTDVLLICSAVNAIDGSALESLEILVDELRDAGVSLSLAEIKGPVMDRLERSHFVERLGRQNIYLSTQAAFAEIVDKRRPDLEYYL